jgi:hypothetical protein
LARNAGGIFAARYLHIGSGDILHRNGDQRVVVGANLNKLRQDLPISDDTLTMIRPDADPSAREPLVQLLVRSVLIAKATLQAPTSAGHLRRVQRGFLHLRHPHADWLEGLKEKLAADLPSAGFIVGKQPSFVTSTYLTHLDPSSVFLRQVLDHPTEIDPFGCGEVENDALPAQWTFALNHLERKVVPCGDLLGEIAFLPAAALDPHELSQISRGGLSQNAPGVEHVGILAALIDPLPELFRLDRVVAASAGQRDLLSQFDSPLRLDYEFRAADKPHVRRVAELTQITHKAESDGGSGVELIGPLARLLNPADGLPVSAGCAPFVGSLTLTLLLGKSGIWRRFDHETLRDE